MVDHADDSNPTIIAKAWLQKFSDAAASGNAKAVAALFLEDGWLRDNLVFTWNHRSLHGHDAIIEYLSHHLGNTPIRNLTIDEDHGIVPNLNGQLVEAAVTFETAIAKGRGLVLLQENNGGWKALSFYVMVDDLKGHEEKQTESGYYDGHKKTWNEIHAEEKARIEKDPYVLIVGAGQSGLNVGARFRQMDIPALLIEQYDTVGDVWRKRYPTLTLHTPNTHHTLLYNRFPTNAPKYTARDKVAAMLEQYAYNQDLVVWTRTQILPTPIYDPSTKRWKVDVLRDGCKVTLYPHHIVLAIGTLGRPYIPDLPGREEFTGVTIHATDFKGAAPYAGKKTIVVGASQTAADICQDLEAHGAASITMIQRSSTIVITSEYVSRKLDTLWPTHGDPLVGDFRQAGMPLGLFKKILIAQKEERVAAQKDMIQGLLKAGLNVNEGEEGAGQPIRVFERLGGYWLDIGTADLIIQGKVEVKQGTQPKCFTGNTLVFEDGTALEADLVVFATGYEPIRNTIRDIFGEDVVAKATPIWGLDEEGENIKAYTPSGYPGLWWAIGDFVFSRYYSKSLALQIKARQLGLVREE